MKRWNVLVPVVEDGIVAGTEAEAVGKLAARLRDAGFEPFLDGASTPPSAFESENQ